MKDFPRQEFETRWVRAQELMNQERLDAIFVTERTNYRYFTGNQTIQFNNKQRPMTFLLPRSGKPAMMVYGLEIELVRDESWVEDVRGYVDVPFPVGLVVDTFRDLGLENGRIGCELGDDQRLWLTLNEFDAIRTALAGAQFVDASRLFKRCRQIKSEEEVARIEQACRITEVAWELIRRRVHPGLNVSQAERICLQSLVDAGSDPVSPGFILLDVLGYGPGFTYKKGDLFFCDLGGSYRGYKADFARMATFGPPSDIFRQSHEQIMQVFNGVLESMQAGGRCNEVAERFNREVEALGYPKLQGSKRIGHGLGLEHQESPSLNIVDETELVPGMVFTPEPRFVRDGHFIMVEEDVVITHDGARKLSTGCEKLYTIDA
jgi:Xaa-Pro aminopeptidase